MGGWCVLTSSVMAVAAYWLYVGLVCVTLGRGASAGRFALGGKRTLAGVEGLIML